MDSSGQTNRIDPRERKQTLSPREFALHAARQQIEEGFLMIYILAVFLPPLALLANAQPFSAVLNFVILVPCLILGLFFPVLFFIPSIHAVIAIYMRREDRKHRDLVSAIERHGPPPGWRP
jgi:cellulose synthase/poly-beta-1,6-N-acetylglucosamine synthase-like glycosyltransferase